MEDPQFFGRSQLPDDVARYVRKRIFKGEFQAGQFLRLDQLAATLGTSVTPVREALLALRGEGWVDQRPRRGFVVLPVTRQDIRDVAALQGHISGELAHRATQNMDAAGLAGLGRIQEEFEQAHGVGDTGLAVRLNHDFHRAINVAADSSKLSQIMSSITRHAPETLFPDMAGWPERSIDEHRRVLDALHRRDADAARAAMRSHFADSIEDMVDHLTQTGVLDIERIASDVSPQGLQDPL